MNAAPASMHAARRLRVQHRARADDGAIAAAARPATRMTAGASGTVIVISKIEMPPASTASAARIASSGDGARTTGHDADRLDAHADFRRSSACHRSILAPAPFIARITSANVAIVVSPGVVIASAPCATPHSSAHCGSLPASRP